MDQADDLSDMQELLSELSKVSGSSPHATPSRHKKGKPSWSGLTVDDVLSPETSRRLFEVAGTSRPGSTLRTSTSSRKTLASSKKPVAAPLPTIHSPELPHSITAQRSRVSDTTHQIAVPDDSELDAELARDPCVLCYEDKVVLRSYRGTCIAVHHNRKRFEDQFTQNGGGTTGNVDTDGGTFSNTLVVKPRSGSIGSTYSTLSQIPASRSLSASVTGNPTESACEFVVVGTDLRAQTGVVKHGDVVALLSRPSGRYLGVYDSDMDEQRATSLLDPRDANAGVASDDMNDASLDGSFEAQLCVSAKRKIVGRREHWTVVEAENDTADRRLEREKRVAASTARTVLRAKKLGYSVSAKDMAPNLQEVPVVVRSSDTILLRSVQADNVYLSCGAEGALRLCRATPHNVQNQWAIVKSPAPYQPQWARERPLLNGVLPVHSCSLAEDSAESISGTKGRSENESDLVNDLLFALQGVQSELVYCKERGKWHVDAAKVGDSALVHLSERLLPLCEAFTATEEFVVRRARPEYGRVSHALAAAMRALLREYQVFLAQLEHQLHTSLLSIQKLWFYVQPSLRTLEVLALVAKSTTSSVGGALLNAVHRLASRGGDAKAKSVYHYLIQHATVPYLEMLELWIYHGVIRDPYDEFMVRVDQDASKKTLREDFNARYWDSRYTLRGSETSTTLAPSGLHGPASASDPDQVPFFLNRIATKILTTGKYLNVVRECGRWVTNSCEQSIPYSDESHAYDEIVSRAHDYASQTLLALLLEEEQLLPRLRSLKHYLLLDQGDFFVHFMDLAGGELKKPVDQITVSRLQSLLEMCLRVRNVNDPFEENLICDLVPYALIEHVEAIHEFAGHHEGQLDGADGLQLHTPPSAHGLHGVDAFTLDFKVKWPLSLVLSRQSLTKYQLIFRHIFFCKYVERQLCDTWQAHQSTKELRLRSALGPDYCLRQRMLHFLQNFQYYIMIEVLEPHWHELERRLESVNTVDELMKHHSEFLDTCLRECLLTHQGLLKTLAKIMTTCLLFAEQVGRFTNQLQVDEDSMQAALAKAGMDDRGSSAATRDEHAGLAEAVKRRQKLRRARIKVQEEHIRGIVSQESYRQMIRRSETTFDTMLSSFMDELIKEATHGEYHSHLTNLCTRLDFNGFYNARANQAN